MHAVLFTDERTYGTYTQHNVKKGVNVYTHTTSGCRYFSIVAALSSRQDNSWRPSTLRCTFKMKRRRHGAQKLGCEWTLAVHLRPFNHSVALAMYRHPRGNTSAEASEVQAS
jgi:hypothetical protein